MEITKQQQKKIIDILNDSASIVSLEGKEYAIKHLKNGTQWLICKEVANLKDFTKDSGSMMDIMESMASNIPVVVKIITLALCNEKRLIFKDGIDNGEFSDYFNDLYDELFFGLKTSSLAQILLEIFNKLDISFFYQSSEMVKMMTKMMMKMVEVK